MGSRVLRQLFLANTDNHGRQGLFTIRRQRRNAKVIQMEKKGQIVGRGERYSRWSHI